MSRQPKIESRDREAILDDGERHFYEGRYDQALRSFDAAVALDDDDADAHFLRARALYYLERFEDAESAYDRALDIVPDFAPALIHKAELLIRVFDSPESALDLLDEAAELELHPEDEVDASFVRGIALMELAEYRRAHEPLNKSVRGDSDWAEALRERGICRFYLWRFGDASRDLERAVARDSSDAEAYQYLAMSYERLGKLDAAWRSYRAANLLDPHSFHPPLRMSREEFERAASEALEDLPEDFVVRFDNVVVEVEDLPGKDVGVQPDGLGVFEGLSGSERIARRSDAPGGPRPTGKVLPCRIRLFQKNLERISPDVRSLKDEISKTVLHEVGHFFGLEVDDITSLQVH